MKPEGRRKLWAMPLTLKEANQFVQDNHRHLAPVLSHKFSVGCWCDDGLTPPIVGVCIVGRPVSRVLDDSWTAEVLRLCTDGTPNAPSFLYGRAWRAARALGYAKLVTYTLDTEPGTSLKAAGFTMTERTTGGTWNCPGRPRVNTTPNQRKLRWEKHI